MTCLEHKGYTGSVSYSSDDKVFWGKVENIEGLITFEAEYAGDVEKNFQQAVDDYLADCARLNIPPQRPKVKRRDNTKSLKKSKVVLQQ